MNNETIICTEPCPYCEESNEYAQNVDKDGFVVKCKNCGKEIFLCDECLHHGDNKGMTCDWKEDGTCFRGR